MIVNSGRKVTLALAMCALVLPSVAHVAETAAPLIDIDAWDRSARQLEADNQYEMADRVFQLHPDLFPMNDEEQGSVLEDSRDARIEQFVSTTIDGKIIVFSDVPRTAWFAPYVRDIADRRIVSGYRDVNGNPTGLFGPGDNITLEQMAKVMLYASGNTTDGCGDRPAANVSASGSWSAPFVSCAEELEWVVYGDGSVDVHRPATRAEVIMTALQAWNKEPQPTAGTGFTDVTPTTQYGIAIEYARGQGIVSGYTDSDGVPNGLFGPFDPVTRAEFAKIVTLTMQRYSQKEE